jgi:putative iron-regulated protein
VNEWPLDENFLDYTADEPKGGIVNSPDDYPEITAEVLTATDHRGGLENLPAGFHAIEFLLWGQRLSQAEGPGNRPYTDYVDDGTAANQDRRRAYLKAATELLLSDMQGVVNDWDLSDPNSYGSEFVKAPTQDSIQAIARGLTDLSISELYYERLLDPYVTMDRKDEESCFSESTYNDLVANATSIENVYLGRYASHAGPGLSDLVRARDANLDDHLRTQLHASLVGIQAIPQPFDHAVIAPASSEEHQKVQAALQTFWPLLPHTNPGTGPQNLYEKMAATLGVVINL